MEKRRESCGEEFLRLGAASESITGTDSEFEAVRAALAWARPGDLLILPLHAERDRCLAFLDRLAERRLDPGRRGARAIRPMMQPLQTPVTEKA